MGRARIQTDSVQNLIVQVFPVFFYSLYIFLLFRNAPLFTPASPVQRNFGSPMSSAAISLSSGKYSETSESVTVELLAPCSLQSTFLRFDRIFIASRFWQRRALVAAEVQNLFAA